MVENCGSDERSEGVAYDSATEQDSGAGSQFVVLVPLAD